MFKLTTLNNKSMVLSASDITKVNFDNAKYATFVTLNNTWWYKGSFVKESVEEVYKLMINDKKE